MGEMADFVNDQGVDENAPAHHPLFPPSSSKRWLSCTASPLPISHGYEGDVSRAAAEGTFAHMVFADRLVHHRDNAYELPLGAEREVDGFTFTLDREMLGYIEQCVDYVNALGPGVMLVEQLVELPVPFAVPEFNEEEGTETITGHADVLKQVHTEPDVLHVLDLKYGKGVRVRAQGNSQMMLYGIMSASTHEMVFEGIERVRVHVLQPRLEVFEHYEFTLDLLQRWVDGPVTTAIREVHGLGEGPTFRPSEEACQWCPLLGQCPAAQAKAAALFDEVPITQESEGSKADGEKGVALMPAEDLGHFLGGLDFFEMVARAARKRALDLLLAREEVPGWKMVEGSSNRQWERESDDGGKTFHVKKVIALADSLEVDPWAEPSLRSVADIEREMGKKAFATSPLAALVVKPQGKPRLAPADDKRPAWHPDDGVDFDEV